MTIHAGHAGGYAARDMTCRLSAAGEVEHDFGLAHLGERGVIWKRDGHGLKMKEKQAGSEGDGVVRVDGSSYSKISNNWGTVVIRAVDGECLVVIPAGIAG